MWWTRNAIAVVGLASLLTAAFVHAGAGDGLEGGSVAALAIDPKTPTTVYAGTGGGVPKSTNGGQSWAASNTSLTEPGVEALALVPSQPATLYAGTSNEIFKSTNGGESWTGLH